MRNRSEIDWQESKVKKKDEALVSGVWTLRDQEISLNMCLHRFERETVKADSISTVTALAIITLITG